MQHVIYVVCTYGSQYLEKAQGTLLCISITEVAYCKFLLPQPCDKLELFDCDDISAWFQMLVYKGLTTVCVTVKHFIYGHFAGMFSLIGIKFHIAFPSALKLYTHTRFFFPLV